MSSYFTDHTQFLKVAPINYSATNKLGNLTILISAIITAADR
ncbi:hypothetical protein CORMATOL_02858 [Corynebacterium matruchotii ATCC 33806]|uniref:Uncharacterized protein n=1 Tax=Corynebacterium matruchotii ATCC 33806 TaxID=566549 RepID=C0E770_9CORY|nr:hypothetical protein CORMATOL_02858 [Corynebacterium matruchotii ATCC 33806]